MAHRQILDPHGARWDVWDVHPTTARDTIAKLYPPRADCARPRRDEVATNLAGGWLCFEHAGERRRYTPIPAGWSELPMTRLAELCAQAVPVPRPAAAPDAGDEARR